MYELTEQKKNDISVYGVKYGDLQIDDISLPTRIGLRNLSMI